MTVSGRSSGGDEEYQSNLKSDCEEEFVAYLVDITALLLENGFSADYLSPINEPQWGWGGKGATQEGCHYESEQILRVGRAVALELERRGLPVKVSLAESGKWYDRNYTLDLAKKIAADDVLKEKIDHYAAHSYWSSALDKRMAAAFFAQIPGMPPLHQTEWCLMEAGRDLGMGGALPLAREIHDDLTILSAASWSWWIAVSAYDYNDGLLYVDPAAKTCQAAKRLWALANYSRFILPGYTRLGVEADGGELPVSAYQSGDGRTTVVVAINDRDVFLPFAIQNFAASGGTVKMYVTSEDSDCREPYKKLSGAENATLPPRSVTTFVYEE
jgi:O-glycosyl hydrolase